MDFVNDRNVADEETNCSAAKSPKSSPSLKTDREANKLVVCTVAYCIA
jgi:hypothetical protein